MKTSSNLKRIGACIPLVFFLGLAACNKNDTSAETTGEKMDQMSDKAGDKMDHAQDKMENAQDKAGAAIDDAAITTKVKAAIAGESVLSALQINVDTVDGVVTLNGEVDSQTNSDKAASVATGVSDVKSVENKLTVKSPS